MELIFFNPVYKDYLWGGSKLNKEYNKKSPFEITAESWEISGNVNGVTSISDKTSVPYTGMGLDELFSDLKLRKEIFGNYTENMKEFPLLIKFIDAKDNLSVQVHPDDEYARRVENSLGKSEAWYIIDCEKDSKIICGLNEKASGKDKRDILQKDNVKEYLNYIPIKKGDILSIPPGTLHAILKDTLICEIQQNSDLTYRVYDWDRVDKNGNSRQLHTQKAIDVISDKNEFVVKTSEDSNDNLQRLIETKYFCIDKLVIKDNETFVSNSNPNSFIAVNVIDGNGSIDNIEVTKGDSFIIPASYGEYKITGNITALMSYLPN